MTASAKLPVSHYREVLMPSDQEAVGDWVMVPREPTADMLRAYLKAKYEGPKPTLIPDLYRAMLSAAPPAPLVVDEDMVERMTNALAAIKGVKIVDEVDHRLFRADAEALLAALSNPGASQ
jgi:hypothetical protein